MVLLPLGSRKDSLNPLTVKLCCWTDKSAATSFVTSSKAALLSHLRCELTLFFSLLSSRCHEPFLMQLLASALPSAGVSLGITGSHLMTGMREGQHMVPKYKQVQRNITLLRRKRRDEHSSPQRWRERRNPRERWKSLLQERYLLHPGQSFQQVLHQPSTFCTAKQRQRQK